MMRGVSRFISGSSDGVAELRTADTTMSTEAQRRERSNARKQRIPRVTFALQTASGRRPTLLDQGEVEMDATSDKRTILVVEDEEAIRRGLCDVLAYQGYLPKGIESGEEGLREALANPYDLILLDLMLPGMSGFDVCEAVRAERPMQPILMLTARGAEADVVEGFARGADDYVTKPFSVSELLARVRSLLRRAGKLPRDEQRPFRFGRWTIDPPTQRAHCGDEAVDLSPREISILALFVREAGRIVSRRTLLQEVWGFANPDRIETRTVDMQIVKLRRKLGAPDAPEIETVRGSGYRFTAEA
jgi:DNA-binding response OmpR family regulator